jgi:hypothetical protein
MKVRKDSPFLILHLCGCAGRLQKIALRTQNGSMKPRVASYFRKGFTMSRRARISHKNNEHPISHWVKILAIDKETITKMLVYAGIHHTGLYAKRTKFYRLPRLNNDKELRRFSKVFHSITATKRKFNKYMAAYLQQRVR